MLVRLGCLWAPLRMGQLHEAVTRARLPQGWEWADEDWKIDMAGLEEGAVDDEGWSYAVDFNWCRIPPPPGAGKFRRVRAPTRSATGADMPPNCWQSTHTKLPIV